MKQNKTIDFEKQKFFIGIDVHKKNWYVAINCNSILLNWFSMNPNPEDLLNHLEKNYPNGEYYCVYEAGFCGFWIYEELNKLGIKTIVIHPADVPTTHKEKMNKSDKIDARKLARELENNTLKKLYVPDPYHQQLRSLCRLRHRMVRHQTRLKTRIKMHLHFYGIQMPPHSKFSHWSKRFIQWLKTVRFPHSPADDYLNFCIDELEQGRIRLVQVTRQLRVYSKRPETKKVMQLLMSVPGVGFIAAITLYTELIDMLRFKRLDELASYVGLVPSVTSSGETSTEYGITQRKNRHLRYILIEAAWTAIRRDPALLLKYNELTRGMKNQDAIVRIAKKLLSRIRAVWLSEVPYVFALIE